MATEASKEIKMKMQNDNNNTYCCHTKNQINYTFIYIRWYMFEGMQIWSLFLCFTAGTMCGNKDILLDRLFMAVLFGVVSLSWDSLGLLKDQNNKVIIILVIMNLAHLIWYQDLCLGNCI